MTSTNFSISNIIDSGNDGESWKVLARDRRLVDAISTLRGVHYLGLKDAKVVVEEYLRRVDATKPTIVSIPTGEFTIRESVDGRTVDVFFTKKVVSAAPITTLPQLMATLALEHGA